MQLNFLENFFWRSRGDDTADNLERSCQRRTMTVQFHSSRADFLHSVCRQLGGFESWTKWLGLSVDRADEKNRQSAFVLRVYFTKEL